MPHFEYKRQQVIRGGIIYAAGDSVAALLSGDFSWHRLLGMLFIGATVYAFEIPNYFNWISRRTSFVSGTGASIHRTALAILYFNPLWIARHLLFIKLVAFHWDEIEWDLLEMAFWSFIVNIPISFLGNFIIQNRISLENRFMASALFSGLMAIYYPLSANWFG